ncbi:VacJ family lipoprotein [Pelagicoccus enzymogenes]|uniref:MlaA family lipoprotein n=1 Tax=Pelagicoccus enzymogenes TaxID=2773457 RepID=UPI00280C6AA1|nr:VacJ family lipoprotein [Pelagicoccus enzymogenes]MDQ8199277.1 VacJ family lipoprotein [Pelagicoccus enzymogenes]
MKASRTILTAVTVAITASLAPAQEDGLDMEDLFEEDFEETVAPPINDPLEGLNRAIFRFNDVVYSKVAKPFARTYAKVVPDPVEKGLGNVFDNAKFPSRFVSNVFQGRFGNAGKETGQFLVNSTAGLGGIFKISDEMPELQTSREDFGQAMGSWGMGHGFYLVIPFMGPTSLRDFAGDFVDDTVEPLPEPASLIDDDSDRMTLRIVEFTNRLPALMDLYDSMRRSAIDPYVSVRDAYTQRRARQVAE